jgi:bla regulator protein BlaR1
MMQDSVARIVLAVSDSLELSIIAKATVVLGLALVTVRIVRRARASVRHVVLASAFGVLVVLPGVVRLLPPVALSVPVSADRNPLPVRPFLGDAGAVTHLPAAVGSMNRAPAAWSPDRIATLLRYAWSALAAIFLVPVAVVLWRLHQLRRGGLSWMKAEPLLRTLAGQAGIQRSIDILRHEGVAAPVTCGFTRPVIVLPVDADEWSDVDVRRAIVHELEHVRRADWPVQLAARVVCALYWFHPLVWIAWRQLCLESERACDDAVLRGAERTEYAEQLVTLASRLSHGAMRPMLSMASRSDLSARIGAVLDSRQPRGRAGVVNAGVTIAIAALVVLALSPLRAVTRAQLEAPGDQLAFDVASVRPNVSGDLRATLQAMPGGRFVATNAPLRTLIREAYALQAFQMSGGPGWLDFDRFDIVAKSEKNPTPVQARVMLRALLAERFQLTVHTETRDLPLYALTLARADGKLGPQLRRTGTDCSGAPEWLGTGPPPLRPPSLRGSIGSSGGTGPEAPCRSAGPGSGGAMRFRGVTLEAFAKFLAMPVRRPVIDRTGLTGDFDIELEMTAELGPPPPPPGMPDRVDRTAAPSIFTAIQEQLGLKLDSQRGPVDVLVIDRVEPLVPN